MGKSIMQMVLDVYNSREKLRQKYQYNEQKIYNGPRIVPQISEKINKRTKAIDKTVQIIDNLRNVFWRNHLNKIQDESQRSILEQKINLIESKYNEIRTILPNLRGSINYLTPFIDDGGMKRKINEIKQLLAEIEKNSSEIIKLTKELEPSFPRSNEIKKIRKGAKNIIKFCRV